MPPSAAGSPGKVRRTPPQRPHFATPESLARHRAAVAQADTEPVDFDVDPPMDLDDDHDSPSAAEAAEAAKKAAAAAAAAAAAEASKKKKTRVVAMLTEDEIEEIEKSTDGSKDHLRVSKPKIDTEDWVKVRRSTHELQDDVKISTDVLPTVDGEGDEKILKFFWLDAQQGENRTSDTVFLFGKVRSRLLTLISCSCHPLRASRSPIISRVFVRSLLKLCPRRCSPPRRKTTSAAASRSRMSNGISLYCHGEAPFTILPSFPTSNRSHMSSTGGCT